MKSVILLQVHPVLGQKAFFYFRTYLSRSGLYRFHEDSPVYTDSSDLESIKSPTSYNKHKY